jgi:hypothetical protein
MITCEIANGGGVTALLPQQRFCPLAQKSRARPIRTIGDERRVSAEDSISLRVAQDEPFNEFPRRRVADRFLYRGRLVCLALAREIDRIPYRREIARERRSVRALWRRVAGPRRLALSNRDMLCMPGFRERGVAVVPHPGRFMRLAGLPRLAAGPRNSVGRTCGEHSQDQDTRQRT